MDETTHSAEQPASLSTLTSWENWVNTTMVWMPYATLGLALVLAQFGSQEAFDRFLDLVLAAVA